jgi:hypothetical protein
VQMACTHIAAMLSLAPAIAGGRASRDSACH